MNRSGLRHGKLVPAYAGLLLLVGVIHAQPAASQEQAMNCTPQNQEVAMHYSLYYENYKNENYQDTLADLHWILEHCPGFPSNKDNNFERAIDIYEGLAEQTDDMDQKLVYLDSALVMFDRVVPVMKELGANVDEFIWLRDKGRFIQKHLNSLDDSKKAQAIEAYRKAYELDPARLDPYYLDVIASDYYTQGDIGGLLDFLRAINDARGNEEGVQGVFKKFMGIVPPEEQIAFLEDQFEKNPDNLDVINQLFTLYQQEGYREEMMEMAPRLLEMDPTPEILRLLIRMYIEDGEYEESVTLTDQLEGMATNMLAQDYFNKGIALQGLTRYGQAYQAFRKALEVDSSFNRALNAIADLYATAVSDCGVGNDAKGKQVFWLVADAYTRAGNNTGAARYRSVFPTAEEIFFNQAWTEGQSTTVTYSCKGLTISGSTVVRKAG